MPTMMDFICLCVTCDDDALRLMVNYIGRCESLSSNASEAINPSVIYGSRETERVVAGVQGRQSGPGSGAGADAPYALRRPWVRAGRSSSLDPPGLSRSHFRAGEDA